MLRPEQIEEYRRMTVRERLRLTLELTAFAEAALAALPREERERRLRILYEQSRVPSHRIVRRLAST